MARVTLRCAAWAVTLSSAAAGVVDAGEVVGKLRNASTLGVVPDFDVRITASLSEGERLDRTTTTDGEGSFRFVDVPADTSTIYVLSTNYQDVEYVSRFFRFAPGADVLDAELEVYDVGDDPSVIRITGHHYVIEAPPGSPRIAVTEVIAIQNEAATSFRPSHPFAFPLPPDATDFEPLEGFANAFVRQDSVVFTSPIRPGRLEGAFRYHLPVSHPFRFEGRQAHPTDVVTALVAPVTAKVTGDDLTDLGEVDLGNGIRCVRFGLPVPPVGSSFFLTIDTPSAVASTRNLAWILVGAILAVFAGMLVLRDRPRSPITSAEIERLRTERDHRVRSLLRHDDEAAANGAGADDGERARLLVKAVAVQELLDAAEQAAGGSERT